jgi:hypothetical protein
MINKGIKRTCEEMKFSKLISEREKTRLSYFFNNKRNRASKAGKI